jgi:hypothetical protein
MALFTAEKILQVAEGFGEPILDDKAREIPEPQNKKPGMTGPANVIGVR